MFWHQPICEMCCNLYPATSENFLVLKKKLPNKGYINIYSRFHRQANAFSWTPPKKTFSVHGQTKLVKSFSQPVNLPAAQDLVVCLIYLWRDSVKVCAPVKSWTLFQNIFVFSGRFQKISIPIPRTGFRISKGEGGTRSWNSEGMGRYLWAGKIIAKIIDLLLW